MWDFPIRFSSLPRDEISDGAVTLLKIPRRRTSFAARRSSFLEAPSNEDQ
jgi:hypothetical protein